jgi:oligoribonuclease
VTIAFIDCETTGLDARRGELLEVACIITDDRLVEIARAEWVIQSHVAAVTYEELTLLYGTTDATQASDYDRVAERVRVRTATDLDINGHVVAMHDKNGLWLESAGSTLRRYQVDGALAAFIREHGHRMIEVPVKGNPEQVELVLDKPQLGGSTISFDRAWLDAHAQLAIAELHYRNLDMTTMNELAKRFWPPVYAARPSAGKDSRHRAMDDIELSIAGLRYYVNALGPIAGP